MSVTFSPTLQKKIDRLSGKNRAAILILSLPEKISAAILSSLDEEEIKDLSFAMLRAKEVDPDIIKAVSIMFVSQLTSSKGIIGSSEGVKRLLT
ncbi:MAG: hypothetical protein Q8R43_00240, partial [Alphaproteobacteria bacterium]|nr:hypothetical protein [Alphaproteobacteria bacterium]